MKVKPAAEYDRSKQEAFAGRMLGVLNDGMLGVMVSVGHRTGLFDTMAGLAPSTSNAIASKAGLQERYVREWLGAMVVGKIVQYDAAARTYVLPREHAASLTRAAGKDNLASFIRFIPWVGKVEDDVVDCFRKGGGVPYSAYEGFSELLEEATGPMFDGSLLDVVLPMVPDLKAALSAGIDVLEVGCGTGHALNLMATHFPRSQFVGYDLVDENVALATANAKSAGLTNAAFEVKDVVEMTHAARFDLVMAFDTIHDQAKPDALLSSIARALRSGGSFLMSDVRASTHLENNLDHPLGPFGYSISCMHCLTVSLAYGGMGLGAMWGEEKAREMIEAAGLRILDVQQVDGDPINNFYIAQMP